MSKIKFEVEIDATNTQHIIAVTNFLQTIGNAAVSAAPAPAPAPAPKEDPKKVEAPKEDPKKVEAPKEEPKKVEAPKEEPKKVEAPKEEPKKVESVKGEPKKSESSLDISKVRALLATKVGDHRATIKNELTRLGATSVSTLDSEHYQAFADFLNSL